MKVGICITGGAASVPLINLLLVHLCKSIHRSNIETVGISGGFGAVLEGKENIVTLTPSVVNELQDNISNPLSPCPLVTERSLPSRTPEEWSQISDTLVNLDINQLVVIGGNGTACTIAAIHRHCNPKFSKLIQIPKTMDGDFISPESNLGFHTAFTNAVSETLAFSNESTLYGSPYLVKVLGRDVGQLALATGMHSKASLILIPEEFSGKELSLEQLVLLILGAEVKKLALTGSFGLSIFAEGILDCLNKDAQEALGCKFKGESEKGIIDYSKTPFEATLRDLLQQKFTSLGIDPLGIGLQVGARSIGYYSRAAYPTPSDMTLAVSYGERAGNLIRSPLSFDNPIVLTPDGDADLLQYVSEQDEAFQCWVDLDDQTFSKSKKYQFRLSRNDLEGSSLAKLSSVTKLSAPEFRSIFKPIDELLD